jgi:winged helix DNA-binding protein
VPVVQAACTDPLVARERKRLVQMIEDNGISSDGARWLRTAAAATLSELTSRGEATAGGLSKAVPQLQRQMSFGEGTRWAGTVGVSTRLLFLLATEQRVVRGRPEGSWASSRYRWSRMEAWLPDGVPSIAPDVARAELVRRWLATFGPATAADAKWWTGWTVGHTKAALAAVGAVEVELEEGVGWVLPDDNTPVSAPKPWVALLPALDPTTMGWQQRRWYLGDHGPAVFDRSGNAGPTVWVDGRIVGGWAQRASGEVVHELLEDVGRDAVTAIDQAAVDLEQWLGDVRVKPRFPTPLQKKLSAT